MGVRVMGWDFFWGGVRVRVMGWDFFLGGGVFIICLLFIICWWDSCSFGFHVFLFYIGNIVSTSMLYFSDLY